MYNDEISDLEDPAPTDGDDQYAADNIGDSNFKSADGDTSGDSKSAGDQVIVKVNLGGLLYQLALPSMAIY